MGKKDTTLGNLDHRGILPVIRAIHHDEWGGALRVRATGKSASLWFVRGQLAHASLAEGKTRLDGVAALETAALWTEGTFMLEEDALPPSRTIRLAMEAILTSLQRTGSETPPMVEEPAHDASDRLELVLDSLRERVPGLESLSVLNGALVEATTVRDLQERGWLNEQLRSYCDEDTVKPEKLFLQQGDHSLLILKRGQLATVLAARTGTAPEALFWAGEEARKRVLTADSEDGTRG